MRFDLYLESGPQHRKTWVYVPSLPGCSTVVSTTEEAIGGARKAIRERVDFLRRHGVTASRRHGETVSDPEPIELVVAAHVIDRGEGKPPRTARRMFRRLLEHEWEHVLELRSRLDR